MADTETKTAVAVELELPPNGGNVLVTSTLEEDAHYLRVTLDKSENFKVVAGEKLRELLVTKFDNNRNALRDWYESNVTQGKAHRAWKTVESYLTTVVKYGAEAAAEKFTQREERHRQQQRKYDKRRYGADPSSQLEENEIKPRTLKTEYDLRREWLADINVLWFKGKAEWQDRWLQDRSLARSLARKRS